MMKRTIRRYVHARMVGWLILFGPCLTLPARGAAEPSPATLWVTVVTHFDRPEAMQPADLEALQQLAAEFPHVRWTHLFNPVAYTQAMPLREPVEGWLRAEKSAGRAEIGLHIHMYRSLVEGAGVAFRTTPSANARQVEGSQDETGYSVPTTAYAPQEMRRILQFCQQLYQQHDLGTPRTFCAGFYTTSRELQQQLIQLGFTTSAAAFPQQTGLGQDYAPSWQTLCGWKRKITHLTRPYWVAEAGITPDEPPPYLRHTLGPLLEVPQTCKIDWMMTDEEIISVVREHLAQAERWGNSAVCLALHEISAAKEKGKFQSVLQELTGRANMAGPVQIRFVTCGELRESVLAHDWAGSLHPAFRTFTPQAHIRFNSIEQATAQRSTVVRWIWPAEASGSGHLPTARPQCVRTATTVLPNLDATHVGHIEQWIVSVPPTDYRGHVYTAIPAHPRRVPQLAVVHAGHVRPGIEHYLSDGLQGTIEAFLERGVHVAICQMPLKGWHQPLQPPTGTPHPLMIDGESVTSHDDMFAQLEPRLGGRIFAIFLEPVIQAINEFEARYPHHAPTVMVGLSGGGWATHMAAALDPRIGLSIPVAGAMPLYARPYSFSSWGDAEQVYSPLYGERDHDGDTIAEQATGLASWLELFALGALSDDGTPRRQIQLLNYDDSCCFGGEVYRTYDAWLAQRVGELGGRWEVIQDRSHQGHQISPDSLRQVILPAWEQMSAEPKEDPPRP